MTSQATPHVVIRLVPESPVDGFTFSTYPDGLALQIIDPITSDPLSDVVYALPLTLVQPSQKLFLRCVIADIKADGIYSGERLRPDSDV